MVSIVPADDAFCNKMDIIPNALCLAAYESGNLAGHIVYTLRKNEVLINDIITNDAAIADGLIRASLNSAAQTGVGIAVCRNESLFDILAKTGFISDEKEMRIDIQDLLGKCCNKK